MIPKEGDIYCVYSDLLGKYVACQVVKMYNGEKDRLTAVLLDFNWCGDDLPTQEELKTLKPLYKTWGFWGDAISLCNVEPKVPIHFKYIGNIPPCIEVPDKINPYGYWTNIENDVYRYFKWLDIPENIRNRFKESTHSNEKIFLSGHEIKINLHRVIDSDIEFKNASELEVLPCLYEIYCTKWYDDILEFVRKNPFISNLNLQNNMQKVLDLRGSNISTLTVQMDTVEELFLNDDLEDLWLCGNISHNFKIHSKDNGRLLTLHFEKTVNLNCGLKNLGGLNCINIKELDMSDIVNTYPNLKELRIWGNMGYIRNLKTVSELKNLQVFTLYELFGFTEEDIPLPEELPKLYFFWATSLSEDAAKEIKKIYKKQKDNGLDLRITGARKHEWIEENLNNPFRNWDGQEHISPAKAKKAAGLYKETRHKILALIENSHNEIQSELNLIIANYTETFNKMNKHSDFIETVEREEIYEALCYLLNLIPQNITINKNVLFETFNSIRDF